MKTDACGVSHRGNIRKHNEDNIYVDGVFRNDVEKNNVLIRSRRESSPYLYAVFDGLGGEACGEEASLIAALGLKAMEERDAAADIDTYVSMAHRIVLKESVRKDARNMGTTVAAAYIDEEKAVVYNVGDSRVYLYRNGTLTLLSKDHSIVQSLIDSGLIRESERNSSSHQGEVTQYIGMYPEDDVEPGAYKTEVKLADGDMFLLCSDGITTEMEDREILEQINRSAAEPAEKIAVDLVRKALSGKCRDNVSVIICKIRMDQGSRL